MVQGDLKFLGTVPELREQVDVKTRSLEDLYLEITSSSTGRQKASSDDT
jgi:hypothetical protein